MFKKTIAKYSAVFHSISQSSNSYDSDQPSESIGRRDINVAQTVQRTENIVGLPEYAGCHNLLKAFFLRVDKNRDCLVKD